MKFSGNYDSSCTSFPKSSKDQKNGLHQKLKDIFPITRMKTKKRSFPQFGTIFGRNWWDLFVLTGAFSSDQPSLKSWWGNAKSQVGDTKSRWGTLSLDGGTRPRYNLTTVWGQCQELKKIHGQGPTFRGQTLSRPRTRMVEAKEREHNFSKLWSVNCP